MDLTNLKVKSHPVWQWKSDASNSMGERACWIWGRNIVFISIYFFKKLLRFKVDDNKIHHRFCERGIPYLFPQEAINNYIELDKKLYSQLQPKLFCSKVIAITLYVFPSCMKKACSELVIAIPDEAISTCLK